MKEHERKWLGSRGPWRFRCRLPLVESRLMDDLELLSKGSIHQFVVTFLPSLMETRTVLERDVAVARLYGMRVK